MALVHEAMEGKAVEESAVYREMRVWAESHGAVSLKMRYPVMFEPGYIGAQATERIGPNEDIVRIPSNLLLSSQTARDSPIGPVIEAHPEVFSNENLESEDLALISFILSELPKGTASFWHPLIQSLPRDSENLSDWTEAELAELHDEDLVYQMRGKDEAMHRNWEALREVLEKYSHFFPAEFAIYENFYWIWQNIATRAFGKYAPSSLFAPIADALNHDYSHTHYILGTADERQHCVPSLVCLDSDLDIPDSATASYAAFARMAAPHSPENNSKLLLLLLKAREKDERKIKESQENKWGGPFAPNATEVFRMCTGADETYEPGAQLYLFYGQYSNRQLLLYYGFTLKHNIYNYAVLKLRLNDVIPTSEAQARIPPDLIGKCFLFLIPHYSLCTELLDFLRMLHWNPAKHIVMAFFSPHDYELELEVVTHAQGILIGELGKDGVSLDEEREKLRENRGIRHYFAVREM
jgi:hypothetical protein